MVVHVLQKEDAKVPAVAGFDILNLLFVVKDGSSQRTYEIFNLQSGNDTEWIKKHRGIVFDPESDPVCPKVVRAV
jgi:hypothetical protein